MPDQYTVAVPIPPKALSPNARPPHWAVKMKAKRDAKAFALVEGLVVRGGTNAPILFARAVLDVVWYGRTANAKRMDDDNAWASLKATRDGLCQAGYVEDDNDFRQGTMRVEVDKANPRVEITIRAGDAAKP